MQPDPYQWWNLEGPVDLNGQGDMLYAVLGPVLTRHVLALLVEAEQTGFELTPELQQLHNDLARADGRSPWLLYQLGLALAAFLAPIDPDLFRGAGPTLVAAANGQRYEILKSAGWFVAERLRSFGFDEATFALNATDRHQWPPRGVACGKVPPAVGRMAPQTPDRAVGLMPSGDTSGLSTAERCLLLDHVQLPQWADGFDPTTRRFVALIQSAVDGRPWATPFVHGWEVRIIGFTYDLWAETLGIDATEARGAALAVEAEIFPRRSELGWQFDT